jgi:DNA-binding transcriptional MerR regulator
MSDEIVKRYYSIGEVAEMFAVNASLLRHWETEFDTIRPKKNRKGERQYTQKDVETIRLIYGLVKDKGFTLQGAKDFMKTKNQQEAEKGAMIESLEKLKGFLTDLRNKL